MMRPACRRRLLRGRSGAVAVEFAAVGTLFLALLVFALYLGLRLYVQVALEHAAARAARLLAVNSTHARSKDQASFQSQTFCPLLSPFLPCASVVVALWPVTDYLNGSTPPQGGSGPPFSAGQGGNLMLLQASYRLPSFAWPAPDGSGQVALGSVTVTSRYPFQNEY